MNLTTRTIEQMNSINANIDDTKNRKNDQSNAVSVAFLPIISEKILAVVVGTMNISDTIMPSSSAKKNTPKISNRFSFLNFYIKLY